MSPPSVAEAVLSGQAAAIARLLRDLDDDLPGARESLRALFPSTGRAHVIGVTGAPGAGKSTLVDRLTGVYREQGRTVGVVAVDPSSPFGGGAILGDRVRMQRHTLDEGVFVRSVATRGSLGGLSRSTGDIVDVLDAAGTQIIIVETVGVGQDEIDIMHLAHTTIVVQVPGLGDEIQALKSGILDIADILVVNKADLSGADLVVRDLVSMIATRSSSDGRRLPDVLKTDASRGDGIAQLVAAIEAKRDGASTPDGPAQDRHRLLTRFRSQLREVVVRELDARVLSLPSYSEVVELLVGRRLDPHTAAERLAAELLRSET